MAGTKLIAISFLLAACSAAAEINPCSVPYSASQVQLVVKVDSDRTAFEQGEIIPLSLSFSTRTQDRFWMQKERYNDIGRSRFERYCVVPEASDPLHDYVQWHGGGGSDLEPEPLRPNSIVIHADLNAYLNLPPGHYRLFVISDRVMPRPVPVKQTNDTVMTFKSETTRSNTVDFDVKPVSPEWQANQLKGLFQILSGNSSVELRLSAAHRLRFLNSKESDVALARLFTGRDWYDPVSEELFFGLYGSPHRQLVLHSLEEQVAAPEHAIGEDFLIDMVWLGIDSDAEWSQSDSATDPNHGRNSDEFSEKRKDHELEMLKVECRRLLAALPAKTGPARALSALGVLIIEADDAEFVSRARSVLIASWDDLPLKSQQEVVANRWSLVDVPAMLPILVRMAGGPVPAAHTWAATVRDAVLSHINQLDPPTARRMILNELQASHGGPTVELLGLLQPEDRTAALQPAVERIIRGPVSKDRLEREFEQRSDFALIGQFGDTSILPQMKQVFERRGGDIECWQLNSILQYFLRVAQEYGAAQVAMLQERKTGTVDCRGSIFLSLDELPPALQPVAVRALDNHNPAIMADAAQSLGYWGSAEAEAALWARLERFHRDWTHRQKQHELGTAPSPPGFYGTAEQNLITALAGGTNWLCTPQKLARLKELAVSENQRAQVQDWLDEWNEGPLKVTPNWMEEDSVEFSLLASSALTEAQMRTKLAEFPQGTRILWQVWQPGYISSTITMKRQEAEYDAMRAVAAEHGVLLVESVSP